MKQNNESKYYNPDTLKTGKEFYDFIITKRNASLREQIDKQNAYIFKTFPEDFMNDRKEVRCTICFKTCHASDSVSDQGHCLMCMSCNQKIREAVNNE